MLAFVLGATFLSNVGSCHRLQEYETTLFALNARAKAASNWRNDKSPLLAVIFARDMTPGRVLTL